jgi:hypothetical protein
LCGGRRFVDEVWVFNSQIITPVGEDRIRSQLHGDERRRLTHFFPVDNVVQLIDDHYSRYFDDPEREIASREISLLRDIFDRWKKVFVGPDRVLFPEDMLRECDKASANPLIEFSRILFHLYSIGKISRDELVNRLFSPQNFEWSGSIVLSPETMPIGIPIHVTDKQGNHLATAIRRAGNKILMETVDGFFYSEQSIETGQVLKRKYQCSIEDVDIVGMEDPSIEIHEEGQQRIAHCDTPKGNLEIREDGEGFVEIKMLVDSAREEEGVRYTIEPDLAEHKVRVRLDIERIEMPEGADDGSLSGD